jgi:hypothetical protein
MVDAEQTVPGVRSITAIAELRTCPSEVVTTLPGPVLITQADPIRVLMRVLNTLQAVRRVWPATGFTDRVALLLVLRAVWSRPVWLADAEPELVQLGVSDACHAFVGTRADTALALRITAALELKDLAVVSFPVLFALAAVRQPDRIGDTAYTVRLQRTHAAITFWIADAFVRPRRTVSPVPVSLTDALPCLVLLCILYTLTAVRCRWTEATIVADG